MFDIGEIPSDLDRMEPGPVLAGWLATIDVSELSGHDRVVVLGAHQRMVSHYSAHLYDDMAAVADAIADHHDDVAEAAQSASAEIRLALQLTRRAADAELDLAIALRDRLPRIGALLARGEIDVRRARVIVDGTAHLTAESAVEVAERIAEQAPRLTTGQLRSRLRRLCMDVDPDGAERQYLDALADRRLVLEASEEGTAHLLGLDLAPDRAAAAIDRVNRLARRLKTRDEPRSIDQLRADVFLDLLSGTATDAGQGGTIELRVDLATLAQLADHPGELAGYGPVVADLARQVASRHTTGSWTYAVTDPDTGRPVHAGTTRRRPTAGQRRMVTATHPTCVFPGCRTPARNCDLDHTVAWAEGGPTTCGNLGPLCRHHHTIRHLRGWSYRAIRGNDHRWTTPLGHTYTTSGVPP